MKSKMNAVYVCLSALWLVGCSPKYYVPNTQNVPLLSERGNMSLSACGNTHQAEIQAAVAIAPRIAVMANGAWYMPHTESNGSGGRGALGEVGAGYFLPLAGRVVFEAYGLVGYGYVENEMPYTIAAYPSTTGKINADMLRFALQPNIGYKSKYFQAAISSRFVSLNFSDIRGSLMYNETDQSAYLRKNNAMFIAEPAITLRGGLEKVKLQLQLAGSYNLTTANFFQETSLLSVGLPVGL